MAGADSFLDGVMHTVSTATKAMQDTIVNDTHSVLQSVKNGVNRAGEIVDDTNMYLNNMVTRITGNDLPKYMSYPTWAQGTYEQNMLGNFDPKTLPKDMPPQIHGYRADPQGKFGGKDGLETQPYAFNPTDIYASVRALAHAKKYGVPQLTAQELTALALKEGLGRMGALSPDPNHKSPIFDRLTQEGMNTLPAQFVALVAEKKATAKRLNIPFAEAWNGTGHSYADANTTGADYARNYKNYYMKAANHPKNKQLRDFIQSALDAEK